MSVNPEQIPLAVLSLTAIILTTSRGARARRWGPVVGLLSQPLWIYATWNAPGQGGMLLVSWVYVAVWIRAIRNNWK